MDFKNSGRFLRCIGSGEFLFGWVMVLAVALLILPVPAWLMDFLLAINISLAVILLLLALQVGDVLKITALPTMLLVATMFRLSLNVSTTRLILLEADAGEIVRSFGNFVVAGNPLVGGVIFLILTVVQFIVIAKGSERVAEVTARFTLDAMPGKQMSIDADLRSGAIDHQAASLKRFELEREAQFHGSMDGAMKFIKGDAIAGIAITLVNIIGGLLVGTLQQGMPVGRAISSYTVLTIGDGLVSQIPALFISIAAGLVVTRVKAERAQSNLGRQIASQVAAHPEVLFLTGAALFMLGLVPQMPTLPFCLFGVVLLIGGTLAQQRKHKASNIESPDGSALKISPVTLVLDSGNSINSGLYESLDGLCNEIHQDLGIRVPAIEIVEQDTNKRWTLLIDDVPVAGGTMEKLSAAGLLDEFSLSLRRAATRFIGVQETQDMLDELESTQPALVREVVPRLVPPVLLAEILARLVEEQVPIRNLRLILATLAEWARLEADPAQLTERVRDSLRAAISYQVAPEGKLNALLLDPAIEKLMDGSLHRTDSGTTLALSPEDGESILLGLDQAVLTTGLSQVIVLTRPELRRPFWKLVCHTHPSVRVVSFLELNPTTSIQPAGKVALAAA